MELMQTAGLNANKEVGHMSAMIYNSDFRNARKMLTTMAASLDISVNETL